MPRINEKEWKKKLFPLLSFNTLKKTNFNYMCFLTLLPLKGDVHKVITL
jgi:hypothetical protein